MLEGLLLHSFMMPHIFGFLPIIAGALLGMGGAGALGVGALSLGASNFLMAPILSLISWYVWAYLIYIIGAKLFPEPNTKADHGQLLRTIGFSSAPGLIRVFGFTPELMTVTFIGSSFWMLACMVVGVRQALDYKSLWKAFGVVVLCWFIQAILLFVILLIFR